MKRKLFRTLALMSIFGFAAQGVRADADTQDRPIVEVSPEAEGEINAEARVEAEAFVQAQSVKPQAELNAFQLEYWRQYYHSESFFQDMKTVTVVGVPVLLLAANYWKRKAMEAKPTGAEAVPGRPVTGTPIALEPTTPLRVNLGRKAKTNSPYGSPNTVK